MTTLPEPDGRNSRSRRTETVLPQSSGTDNPKNRFATSTSVHPLGPASSGLLGGASLKEDSNLFLMAMQEQQKQLDRRKWVAWVDEEYTKAKNARANFENQWYLNLAFTGGRQYVSPITVAGQFRLTVPKSPPWRVKLVINKIRVAVRREASKLSSNKPIPVVVPATGENEDYASAKVGEALVKTQFGDEIFGDKYRSWVWWGVVCGNSFIKSHWDASCPDYDTRQLPNPSEVLPAMPDGSPIPPALVDQMKAASPRIKELLETPQPSKGKIKYEVVTPFHLFVPDLLAEDLEDQPFVIHVMTRDPLWVKKSFPNSFPGDQMPTTDSVASNTIIDSVSIITKNAPDTKQANSCLVKEIWIKPGAHLSFPEGGMLTIVNDKIVQEFTTWPNPFPEFPFYPYYGIPTGGFYRDSTVQDLIPVQKEYNRKRSQSIEIMNTLGKPKLLYPQGAINPKMISSEPGQAIPYTPGYEKPTELRGAEVPASFNNEIATLTAEFDDISSQHDISRGDAPADVKSGTAIAFLGEQDDIILHYQVAGIEAAMQKLGTHHLNYVSKYWDGDRLVKVVGKDNQYEALSWKQNALRGNTDVRCQSGSALPYSKAARTAQVVEFMTNGWLPPENGFEMLNLGGMDKVLDELLVDKRQAMRENLKMAQAEASLLNLLMSPAPGPNGEPVPPPFVDPKSGQEIPLNWDGTPFSPQPPVPVNSWDNHEVHIKYHNDFRKTQEFETLPQENKDAFELHVQTHMFAMSAQMVNQRGVALTPSPNPPAPIAVGPNGEPIPPEANTEESQEGPAPEKAEGDPNNTPSSPPPGE